VTTGCGEYIELLRSWDVLVIHGKDEMHGLCPFVGTLLRVGPESWRDNRPVRSVSRVDGVLIKFYVSFGLFLL